MSSHILSDVQLIVDDIGILANGTLGYEGEMQRSGNLEELFLKVVEESSLGNSLKMQQKNRPYKRIQQVGEKNVHFKIVQGNFPEKRA